LRYGFISGNNWWLFLAVSGESIRKMRVEAGLTQKRLGELVGVSQAHVAKIEQGKVDPRLSTVNRILTVLGEGKQKKCGDIMTCGVIFAKPYDTVLRVRDLMMRYAVSQLPVMSGNRVVGTVTEETIVRNLRSDLAEAKVKEVMDAALPTVQEQTGIEAVRGMLEKYAGVLVAKGKEIVGIVTRSDLLKTIG